MTATAIRRSSVRIGQHTVAYIVTGSGPGVVLVHGAGATKDTNWGPLIARLQHQGTVVALDLPGSGDTLDAGEPLDLDKLVADVVGAARAAGLESFQLVGYSMGAVVAAAVAAQHPAMVQALVLVAGWAWSDTRMRYEFDLWQRLFQVDRALWVRFALLTGSGPAFFAAIDDTTLEQMVQQFLAITPDGVARQAAFITGVDIRARLAHIRTPTLVIGLTHDQQVPIEHSQQLHQAINGAQFVTIESGHLVPWQHPDQLADQIETFLSRVHST